MYNTFEVFPTLTHNIIKVRFFDFTEAKRELKTRGCTLMAPPSIHNRWNMRGIQRCNNVWSATCIIATWLRTAQGVICSECASDRHTYRTYQNTTKKCAVCGGHRIFSSLCPTWKHVLREEEKKTTHTTQQSYSDIVRQTSQSTVAAYNQTLKQTLKETQTNPKKSKPWKIQWKRFRRKLATWKAPSSRQWLN